MKPLSRREFTISIAAAAAAATRAASAKTELPGPAGPGLPQSPGPTGPGLPPRAAGDGHDSLAALTLADASARIKAGTVTSTDLVTACLARIETYNPKINAF